MKKKILRVIISGAESSGKSTITRHLAKLFDLPYALEFARFYLEEHGPQYDLELLKKMGRLHLDYQRERVVPDAPMGIFDTDLINYKIWAEKVFGSCPPEILAGMEGEKDHLYLLCEPDLVWEPDPLRENPYDRQELFQHHVDEVVRLGRPYELVNGSGRARLENAEAAFRRLLAQ
ncbi:MAG: ATP-binding protein [Thermodesulfobacteriota bacterium]